MGFVIGLVVGVVATSAWIDVRPWVLRRIADAWAWLGRVEEAQ